MTNRSAKVNSTQGSQQHSQLNHPDYPTARKRVIAIGLRAPLQLSTDRIDFVLPSGYFDLNIEDYSGRIKVSCLQLFVPLSSWPFTHPVYVSLFLNRTTADRAMQWRVYGRRNNHISHHYSFFLFFCLFRNLILWTTAWRRFPSHWTWTISDARNCWNKAFSLSYSSHRQPSVYMTRLTITRQWNLRVDKPMVWVFYFPQVCVLQLFAGCCSIWCYLHSIGYRQPPQDVILTLCWCWMASSL